MKKSELDRRDFLKSAVVGGAAAAGGTAALAAPETAQAQQPATPPTAPQAAGYEFLNLDEAAFIEALVDHMVPVDEISPKGTDPIRYPAAQPVTAAALPAMRRRV